MCDIRIEVQRPDKRRWIRTFSEFIAIGAVFCGGIFYIIYDHSGLLFSSFLKALLVSTFLFIYRIFVFSYRFEYPFSVFVADKYVEVTYLYFWKLSKRRYYLDNIEVLYNDSKKYFRVFICKKDFFRKTLTLSKNHGWGEDKLKELLMELSKRNISTKKLYT